MDTEPCISLLFSAKEKKKKNSLSKLKQYATDRQYLSTMMKRYADGQGIGLRISRQFSTNGSKIAKELEILNALCERKIEYSAVISPASPIYEALESTKLTEKQQKCIQAKALCDRAKEEKEVVLKESIDLYNYLVKKSNAILEDIIVLQESEKSRKNLGMLQFLHLKHLNIELLSENCYLDSQLQTSCTVLPKVVHDILRLELLSNQVISSIPTKEEMQQILEELKMLEDCNDSDNDEDDEDVNGEGEI